MHTLAPAKLNLRLEVLGKRPDGFHELVTDMLAIDLVDKLHGRRISGGGITLALSGPALGDDVPSDQRNLVYRAAQLVQQEAARRGLADLGLELCLEKQIPSQAGLGGASSDAAAAILLTSKLLGCDLGAEWMGEQLAQLGSDCRFFLDAAQGFARCTGRGEVVQNFKTDPPAWSIAVATPDVACATPDVFRALRFPLAGLPGAAPLGVGTEACVFERSIGNHLFDAALCAFPALANWRGLFDGEAGAQWQLSGSGASVFALFDSEQRATVALEQLRSGAAERKLHLRNEAIVGPAGHGALLVD